MTPPPLLIIAGCLGFAFFVIFYGSLVSVLYFAPRNLGMNSRDADATASFSTRALGFRMSVAEAKKGFVWPMEVVRLGKVEVQRRPGDEDPLEEIAKLEMAGRTKIWVTPKIPFMVPMAAGYVLAFAVGNPMMPLFGGGGLPYLAVALVAILLLSPVAFAVGRSRP